jgi:hypothetical protein
VGMRNLLAHEYFRIEYSHVRDVVEVHVPDLAAATRRLLSETDETDGEHRGGCVGVRAKSRLGGHREFGHPILGHVAPGGSGVALTVSGTALPGGGGRSFAAGSPRRSG